ncbi:MazG-like family protein [Streptomyces lunalinharesii]|uniref:NTP pyrophosphohydrolase MazG putative catalytic core domain-containing protein n=1 Tax=Streptomyces lunalinharesii TaxID=333384 RepID=A0ABN3SFN3_9ACTN
MSDPVTASSDPAPDANCPPAAAPSSAGPTAPAAPTDPADAAPWRTVEALVGWLDRESALPKEQERLLRVLKLSEEVGEAAQAVIGATGQNPRKGRSHTWDDVHAELCDVIVTAMVALRTLTPEARQVFEGHLRRVAERVPGSEAP